MEIRSYLAILWNRKLVVLLTPIITVAIVGLAIMLMTPMYSSSAVVRIAQGSSEVSYTELTYADRLTNTYVQLLKTRPYLQEVIERLNLATDPRTLGSVVQVQGLPETELIEITASSTDASEAAGIADTLAALLVEEGSRIAAGQSGPNHQILVVEPAIIPEQPSSPRPALYLVLAIVVGLAGGLGLAFFFENLDTTVRSSRQLEALAGVPLIGTIPVLSAGKLSSGPVLLNGRARPEEQEPFHMLGMTAVSAVFSPGGDDHQRGKVIMVASAEPDAGKTTVLSNLAVAVARAGYQVAVVDADLKRPSLHRVFGVDSKPGLREVLANAVRLPQALRPSRVPGVKVMPVGAGNGGSELLMNPPRVKQLLRQLSQEVDFVFVDSPPVLDSADPAALGPAVDGVLLVAVRGESTEDEIQRALKQLQRVGARTLGVVLNKCNRE